MKVLDTVGGFHLLNYFPRKELELLDEIKDW